MKNNSITVSNLYMNRVAGSFAPRTSRGRTHTQRRIERNPNSPKRNSSTSPAATSWVPTSSRVTRIRTLSVKSKSESRGSGPRHGFPSTTEMDVGERLDVIRNCRPLASSVTNLYRRLSFSIGVFSGSWFSMKHTVSSVFVSSLLATVRSVISIAGMTK